jgi:hypothetical protein
MKLYPESSLPLQPASAWERYALYIFERKGRWLILQVICTFISLAMWGITQFWLFGALALLQASVVIDGYHARAVYRMIVRAGVRPPEAPAGRQEPA